VIISKGAASTEIRDLQGDISKSYIRNTQAVLAGHSSTLVRRKESAGEVFHGQTFVRHGESGRIWMLRVARNNELPSESHESSRPI
jgi:hypothetical protein